MSIPKTSRLCNTDPVSRDDANATIRELNARINSVYTQESALIADNTNAIAANVLLAFGKTFSGPATALALAHGVPTLIPNPLGVGLSGVIPLNCDTQAMPSLTVSTSGAPAGQAFVTALYPVQSFIQRVTRIRSNGLGLTSPSSSNTVNVCTTPSILLGPGDWSVQGFVGFQPGATTSVTRFDAGISLTSASLPIADSLAVPTMGETRLLWSVASEVPVSDNGFAIPPYQVTVGVGATTTLFLVAGATFSTSTMNVYGSMEARLIGPAPNVTANVTYALLSS